MTHRIQDQHLRHELEGILENFVEMSIQDMKSLMDCDDDAVDRQFIDCSAARQMERLKSGILEKNVQIARENLDKEQRFHDLRNTLLQMCHEAKQVKKTIEELEQKAPNSMKTPKNLDSVQAVLEAAAREADDASEKIVENFLDSQISAEDFLGTFVDSRKNAHLRRVRAEKIVELINQGNRTQNIYPPTYPMTPPRFEQPNMYRPTPPPFSSGNYMPPYPPYGGGPMSMPTPGS